MTIAIATTTNVIATTIKPFCMIIRKSISKEEIGKLPIVDFAGRIHIVQTPQEAEHAVAYLKQFSLLGMDSETRPSFKKGHINKLALLQIATNEEAFLFRINKTGLTLPLITLLENPRITKVGLSLKDDFHKLHECAPFQPRGIVELQEFVRLFGIKEMSLRKIYAILFAQKISKRQQLSNWEADELTIPQQQYAAIDAWACLQIYNLLQELKASGDFEIEEINEQNI